MEKTMEKTTKKQTVMMREVAVMIAKDLERIIVQMNAEETHAITVEKTVVIAPEVDKEEVNTNER
jgi:hypothetical protein